MQLSLRHWPDMRLTWVSGCAMVHSGQEPGAGMTALVANASGTGELPVVVTSHTIRLLPAMMNELADVLAEHLPQRCTRVRLIAWNSGCLHDDRPAPAYQLATRLGLEVIAPAGPLLGVPGGSLFAAAGRGAQRPGGWWRFAPGSAPSRVGWRYPAPHWDADLGEGGDLGNGLVVDQIPAGLWLHRGGYRSMTDLVFSVPVDPDNPALVVSHPDEEPMHREDLARALAVLPRRTVERLVFTPYGPDPVTDGRLGEVAAQLLGIATRTRAGLPLYGSGGQRALVTVDCDGRPRWRPFVRELRCDPRTESVEAADWVNPAPDLLSEPIAPATFTLGSGWAAEVIEAGLWIRPTQSPDPGEWARGLPLDVNECAIVLGTTSGAYPPPPAALLDTLLERLPADARNRIRFAVPRGADDDIIRLAASLADQVPGDAEVRVISAGGRRRARAAFDERTIDERTIDERAIDNPTSSSMPALRDPTPYPPRPAYQPAAGQPAHAADDTSPLRQPTPYPPHPAVRQPTPYPPHPAVRQPTPYPPHPAVRQPTPYPPHPAVRQPTPYPPHPAVQQPTPYPPQPTVRQPAHAAHEAAPPTQTPPTQTPPTQTPPAQTPPVRQPTPYPPHPAVRQPTPYPPHPAVQQPTPYPPQPTVHQPAHAAHPSGRLPFPSSTHGQPALGAGRPDSPLIPPAPVTPPPMTQTPVSPAPLPPSALSSAPLSPAPLPPSPVPPPTHAARQPMPPNPAPSGPPAPVSPAPFPSFPRAVRTPGPPPMPPMPSAQQPGRPAYPSTRPAGPGSRQPVPSAPMAVPPVHAANRPSAPPVHAARQPFPQPAGQPRPQVTGRATPPMAGPQAGSPTGSHQPVAPVRDPAAEPSLDDSQELLQRTEIRSHRTAAGKGGRASRDDDKANASDLNRLLGFFDEIRKARAWDEEPAGSRPRGA